MPDDATVSEQPSKPRHRRLALIALAVVALPLVLFGRPAWHLLTTARHDLDTRAPLPPDHADDASRLEATPVTETWAIPVDAADPEGQLAALLARARREGLRVSIAGARHSMGGHTIYPGGIVIDMLPWRRMALAADGETLAVGAGALWTEVIPYLDARGRSVAVMQSDRSFSVGGSISVNCHGWPYGRPPIASSVESIRIMLADGRVRRCSRDQEAELFALALGGYGLFGVILDVELRTVPNARYRSHRRVVPATELVAAFDAAEAAHPELGMAYARLNIDPEHLFEQAILTWYAPEDGAIPPLIEPAHPDLERAVIRGSEGSAYGKRLRWRAETGWEPLLAPEVVSRNALLNGSVRLYENRSEASTDIIHEYFVPRAQAAAFLATLRTIVTDHGADLINVTVRDVRSDHDTVLRYADQDVLAVVMLFVQRRDDAGEDAMRALTVDLIDAALDHGGRHYLPYRLHATRAQFARAYPQAERFFARKRHYDPDELFQNRFSLRYAAGDSDAP